MPNLLNVFATFFAIAYLLIAANAIPHINSRELTKDSATTILTTQCRFESVTHHDDIYTPYITLKLFSQTGSYAFTCVLLYFNPDLTFTDCLAIKRTSRLSSRPMISRPNSRRASPFFYGLEVSIPVLNIRTSCTQHPLVESYRHWDMGSGFAGICSTARPSGCRLCGASSLTCFKTSHKWQTEALSSLHWDTCWYSE